MAPPYRLTLPFPDDNLNSTPLQTQISEYSLHPICPPITYTVKQPGLVWKTNWNLHPSRHARLAQTRHKPPLQPPNSKPLALGGRLQHKLLRTNPQPFYTFEKFPQPFQLTPTVVHAFISLEAKKNVLPEHRHASTLHRSSAGEAHRSPARPTAHSRGSRASIIIPCVRLMRQRSTFSSQGFPGARLVPAWCTRYGILWGELAAGASYGA